MSSEQMSDTFFESCLLLELINRAVGSLMLEAEINSSSRKRVSTVPTRNMRSPPKLATRSDEVVGIGTRQRKQEHGSSGGGKHDKRQAGQTGGWIVLDAPGSRNQHKNDELTLWSSTTNAGVNRRNPRRNPSAWQ